MDYMMGGVLTRWVIARMPLPSLVEVRRHLHPLSLTLWVMFWEYWVLGFAKDFNIGIH
jgi:hypothetical protein